MSPSPNQIYEAFVLASNGWQDGSGLELFLRSPDYEVSHLVVFTKDGLWYARVGVTVGAGAARVDTALQLLRIEMTRKRRIGRWYLRLVEDVAAAVNQTMNDKRPK